MSRVLVVNHSGQASGAERSMLTLLAALPAPWRATLACPLGGPLERMAREAGFAPRPLPPGDAGLRLHPTGTPKAVAALGRAAVATARHAHRTGADLIHANSLRGGLIAVAAGRIASRPVVVHLRDVLPRGTVADATLRVVNQADEIIAISQHVADSVAEVLRGRPVHVIHNPVDLGQFDPERVDGAPLRAELGIPAGAPVLGVVGQISPWKGQTDAVEALASLKHEDAHLLIAGEVKFAEATTRYDNRAYDAEIDDLIAARGLPERVHRLGERDDVPAVLAACDVLLVPSWSEPFGRVVIEAMAMGTAVIATDQGGPPEIIKDGETGLLAPPREPARWAQRIDELLTEPARLQSIADAGRRRAQDFSAGHHAERVLAVYHSALAQR